jgi:hypothetical protein
MYQRCGKSEVAHSVMKEDLAGRKLPSGKIGENAAWWSIMVLAHNLNSAMKNLVLQGSWAARRMKVIRFHLINLPAKVIEHAWELSIRLSGDHHSFPVPLNARMRIMEFGRTPSG